MSWTGPCPSFAIVTWYANAKLPSSGAERSSRYVDCTLTRIPSVTVLGMGGGFLGRCPAGVNRAEGTGTGRGSRASWRYVRFGTDYEETRRLPDGTPVRMRLLRPDDRAKLLAGFDRLSDDSRYARFFTAMPRLSDATLDRLLATDGWNHLAIGAEAGDQPPETAEGLGVARFIRL